jgi:mono/diheme cytochrome c family protein
MKALLTALLAGLGLAVAGLDPAAAGESVEYLYRLHCFGCHGSEGAGSKIGRIPPFVGLVGHFAASREGRLYLTRVPGVANAALSDADTANLLNYVLRTWGGRDVPAGAQDFTAGEVNALRNIHLDDVAALRRKLAARLSKDGISMDY